jgi:hypothetical protein
MERLMTTTGVLNKMLEPLGDSLNLEAARCLADLRIDATVQARIAELADRANEGLLTDAERVEYKSYVDGVGLINILRSKARQVLANSPGV